LVRQDTYKLLPEFGAQCPSPCLFSWLLPSVLHHTLYWLLGILVQTLIEKYFKCNQNIYKMSFRFRRSTQKNYNETVTKRRCKG
jgi:hypothetical protein